jgi:2-haloacid dehalogenase
MADRWATFDCYGTLVDWNAGIRGELERLFGGGSGERLLARYHEVEPQVERELPSRTYREVLAVSLRRLADIEGLQLAHDEVDALARSLPRWPVFLEVPEALREARAVGWRLCILSNTDRDLLEASMEQIGVPFDRSIVASELGSYKPGLAHWQAFASDVGRLPDVHVAASLFHDIGPANQLGLPSVWINRLGEDAGPQPTRELATLDGLAAALDELAPA